MSNISYVYTPLSYLSLLASLICYGKNTFRSSKLLKDEQMDANKDLMTTAGDETALNQKRKRDNDTHSGNEDVIKREVKVRHMNEDA